MQGQVTNLVSVHCEKAEELDIGNLTVFIIDFWPTNTCSTHNPENTVTDWKAIQCRKESTKERKWSVSLVSSSSSSRGVVQGPT